MAHAGTYFAILVLTLSLVGCIGADAPAASQVASPTINTTVTADVFEPVLVMATSQFNISFADDGKKIYTAGDGKVVFLDEEGNRIELVDNFSKALQKAFFVDIDGERVLVTLGGTKASLNFFREKGGEWVGETVWAPDLVRLRDAEYGDVDGDGEKEFVAATHDDGGVWLVKRVNGSWLPEQLWKENGTNYTHEIELGDFDGDGVLDIFANPSAPNVDVGINQPGSVRVFMFHNGSWKNEALFSSSLTHAKELLAFDVNGDNRSDVIAPVEGHGVKNESAPFGFNLVEPTQLLAFAYGGRNYSLGTASDLQCRSLVAGDVDGDGVQELALGCRDTGVYLYYKNGSKWLHKLIDKDSRAAVHALAFVDFNADGKEELVVANDNSDSVDVYAFSDGVSGGIERRRLASMPEYDWVWTIYPFK